MMLDLNNLQQSNYKFILPKAPNLEFRIQRVRLPEINLGSAEIPSPFVRIKTPGNLTYSPLYVTFTLSESMAEYEEIFNWMMEIGNPDSTENYPRIFRDTMSDLEVIVLSSASKPIKKFIFTDGFPIHLGEAPFDATVADPTSSLINMTAGFDYTSYKMVLPT